MMMESKIHSPPIIRALTCIAGKENSLHRFNYLYNKKSKKLGAWWMSLSKETLVIVTTVIHQNGCCSILLSIIFVLSIMLRETIDVDTVGLLLLTSEQKQYLLPGRMESILTQSTTAFDEEIQAETMLMSKYSD